MPDEFENSDPWNFNSGEGAAPARPGSAPEVRLDVKQSERDAPFALGDSVRRRYDRVTGPFDGYRVSLIETPVRIYDLSLGGCFVNSSHEQRDRSTVVLKIDLPQVGWITVNAETVYRRPGFGFAVRFIDVDAATSASLIRVIDALKERQGGNA